MRLKWDETLGLIVWFNADGKISAYTLERYFQKYRKPGTTSISANKLPGYGTKDVEGLIQTAKENRLLETQAKAEKLNELLQEYFSLKLKRRKPGAVLIQKFKDFGELFYITDNHGIKAFSPFPKKELEISFMDVPRVRCLLSLVYDERTAELFLKVVEEKERVGFLYGLDRYLTAIREKKFRGRIRVQRVVKETKESRRSLSLSFLKSPMDASDWLAYEALKIIEKTGYPTVWDFLRAFQDSPVVEPEEKILASTVFTQLNELYRRKRSEGISKNHPWLEKIQTEIKRLAVFLKNPDDFSQTIQLSQYGQIAFAKGTAMALSPLPAWESLYLTNEVEDQWIKVGNGVKIAGSLTEEAKLWMLDEPASMELGGKRGAVRTDVLIRRFGHYVLI